jgi:hypothetical protein
MLEALARRPFNSLAAMSGTWSFEEGGTTKPKHETGPRWIIRMINTQMDIGREIIRLALEYGPTSSLHWARGNNCS